MYATVITGIHKNEIVLASHKLKITMCLLTSSLVKLEQIRVKSCKN